MQKYKIRLKMTISDNLLNRKATPKIKVKFFLLFKIVPFRSNAAATLQRQTLQQHNHSNQGYFGGFGFSK